MLNKLDTVDKYEYLFINLRHGTLQEEIHTGWYSLRLKAGLPHLRIHDLMYSFASFLVNKDWKLHEVQQILGLSIPTVTQGYLHLSAKTLLPVSDAASNCIKAGMAPNHMK